MCIVSKKIRRLCCCCCCKTKKLPKKENGIFLISDFLNYNQNDVYYNK